MESILCHLDVALPAERAFAFFTQHFAMWWPRECTWSQDVLEDIGIEPREGGLCYEHGPHGFRCDWGRVLSWGPPHHLVLAWQISPRREPEPNPGKASTLDVTFVADTPARTRIMLEHRDLERHGHGAAEYRAALASAEGWPWVLNRYAAAVPPNPVK
jgi:uncharacterized protein YndB with AHSA1/START domain